MVHEIARKAWSIVITLSTHEGPGREQGGDRRWDRAGGEEHDHDGRARRAPPWRPSPSGTTWRRTRSGSSTTSTSVVVAAICVGEGLPRAPHQHARRRPASTTVARSERLRPRAGPATITRSPLSVIMPGNTVCPIRPERGGITSSATPFVPRLKRASPSTRAS